MQKKILFKRFITLGLLAGLFIPLMTNEAYVEEKTATAVFAVGWYGVGKSALEGQNGVKKVTNGWKGFHEVNTVEYYPSKISVKEMEESLKKARTYLKTFRKNE